MQVRGCDFSMKILFVGPMLGRHANRVPNPAEELAPHLQERGFECTLSSFVPNRYLRLLDMLWTILKNARNIDVISLQTYSGPSFLVEDAVSWLARCLRLRLVMVLHGGAMPEFNAAHPRWTRRVLNRANCLVTPSVFVQNEMAKSGFSVRVIPNGMDISRYAFRLRTQAGPRLLWLRAFHAIYQPQMAVRVLARLAGEFPALTLTMIGPSYKDGALAETQQLARALGVFDKLQMVGYLPKAELPGWLEKGEIFLNTTRYESFGISTMEAAATGLPIVTTNVGELPYLWHTDQNAQLVAPDDVAGMAAAVRAILTDDALCVRLSLGARQKAEQYDWSVVLPDWEALFREVMEQAL